MANRHMVVRVSSLLLVIALSSSVHAALSRESEESPSVRDRIIRLLKKIPLPILPRIFDDPVIPKP